MKGYSGKRRYRILAQRCGENKEKTQELDCVMKGMHEGQNATGPCTSKDRNERDSRRKEREHKVKITDEKNNNAHEVQNMRGKWRKLKRKDNCNFDGGGKKSSVRV